MPPQEIEPIPSEPIASGQMALAAETAQSSQPANIPQATPVAQTTAQAVTTSAAPPAIVPVAQPVGTQTIPMFSTDELLLERIRRLEDSLNRLAQIQALESRAAQTQTTLRPNESPSQPMSAPSVLDAARVLMDAGNFIRNDKGGPVSPETPRNYGPTPPPPTQPLSLLRDLPLEMLSIYYMYVDPRYRMSWFGRVIPPILAAVFFLSGYLLGLTTCGIGSWSIVNKPVDLFLCYLLVRVVGAEARRYRQTAPDLPSNLRL
jgi:hypothetical protein